MVRTTLGECLGKIQAAVRDKFYCQCLDEYERRLLVLGSMRLGALCVAERER